jgi:hypothetical protein
VAAQNHWLVADCKRHVMVELGNDGRFRRAQIVRTYRPNALEPTSGGVPAGTRQAHADRAVPRTEAQSRHVAGKT